MLDFVLGCSKLYNREKTHNRRVKRRQRGYYRIPLLLLLLLWRWRSFLQQTQKRRLHRRRQGRGRENDLVAAGAVCYWCCCGDNNLLHREWIQRRRRGRGRVNDLAAAAAVVYVLLSAHSFWGRRWWRWFRMMQDLAAAAAALLLLLLLLLRQWQSTAPHSWWIQYIWRIQRIQEPAFFGRKHKHKRPIIPDQDTTHTPNPFCFTKTVIDGLLVHILL